MMTDLFRHERDYRGDAWLRRVSEARITLCGAGALGSNIADNLARQGARVLRVIDRDRVEAHNAGTQIYGTGDVGAWKVDVLKNRRLKGRKRLTV